MAEAIVGPLVGKLQDLALSEAKALVAVNNDIRTLRDRLMWMQAFLRLADQQRRNSYDELIRVLIKQTRDAAFDAEDAIDLFILKVDLSRDPSWTRSIFRFIAGFTTHVSIRHNLSLKIQDINRRLEQIIQNKDKYVLDSAKKNSEMVLWRPSAIESAVATTKMDDIQAPLVKRKLLNETGGTNGDLLIDQLASKILNTHSMELVVINVTGKRGVGKATLVRQVYERPETQTLFEESVWVSFPPYLSVSNIVHSIYHQQTEDKTWFHGKDVHTDVNKNLENKKFLLVIDGEVSNTDWRTLLSIILPKVNTKGSRVVRIMQGSHKPDGIQDGHCIQVMPFNQGETKELFHKWVANQVNNEKGNPGDKTAEMNGEQEDSEDKIFEKMDADLYRVTGGLPLAIVILCGLLQTKEYPKGWLEVFKHLISRQSNQLKRLDIILTMCFDDLPHDLKSCLLYFAVLPKNTPIEAHKLLCMWMAEGFLRPTDGKTMEKMGRIYLKDLVARNLVKVVKKDFFTGEEFVAVHHKIHAFLQGEAQEANFVDIYNCADTPSLTNVRRLSLQNYSDKYAALANPLPKLRSILSSFQEEENVAEEEGEITSSAEGSQSKKEKREDEVAPKCFILGCGQGTNDRCKHIRRMFEESRYLRVINLQGVEIGNKLPKTIRNVPHLQYLGVTACSLEFIPKEIGELKDLQTLDVRDTKVKKLPRSFWKIKTLRHVFGSSLTFPKKVGDLKNLQTLETIRPDEKHGWDEKTFEKMVHLQSLYVWDTSSDTKNNVKALCVVIENPKLFEYLEKLILEVTSIPHVVFTSSSQRRLRSMALCGELQKPSKLEKFCVPNLTFLSLEKTKVSQDFIKRLGKLPLLANLMLDEDSYEEEQGRGLLVFSDGEFMRLKKLTLSKLNYLEKLVIGTTALPELTDLVILSCKAINNIEVNGKCKCVQTSEGMDYATLCSKFKPVEEVEGKLLEKLKGHYGNISSRFMRVVKFEGEDPNVCTRCKCVDKIKGDDEYFCSRCKFVEKIKDGDKKLYGCIRQKFFKGRSG